MEDALAGLVSVDVVGMSDSADTRTPTLASTVTYNCKQYVAYFDLLVFPFRRLILSCYPIHLIRTSKSTIMGETLSTCVSDGADNAQAVPAKQELEQVIY